MICQHFGICNSCNNYEGGFEAQNARKKAYVKALFLDLYSDDIVFYASSESHYRARSEFRIWHDGDDIYYALNDRDKKIMQVLECPKVSEPIAKVMMPLLESLKAPLLRHKLFGVDFLSASSGELCVTLLYHKKIDEAMQEGAKALEDKHNIHVILRARKQKVVLSQDYVREIQHVEDNSFTYLHVENSFTQPNHGVNEKMIHWSLQQAKSLSGDLLELYCGAGNFTIPFAKVFDKVLATEISKSSIAAAKENMRLNGVQNIDFVRMSAEEFVEALDGVREFRRMREIDLKSYTLQTIFVDPPRAGLDEASCDFASRFNDILYISCNPQTLHRDLLALTKTHNIVSMAAFDQFAYTNHIEMGVHLTRR